MFRKTSVTGLVSVVVVVFLSCQVHSQDNILPKKVGGLLTKTYGLVNGHSGVPVKEVIPREPSQKEPSQKEPQLPNDVQGFINGPTGTSVKTQEGLKKYVNGPVFTSQLEGQVKYVNGPTLTSVALEEGQGKFGVVNGPTGISVKTEEQQQEQQIEGEKEVPLPVVDPANAHDDLKNRGRISTDPEEVDVKKEVRWKF